MPDRKIWTVEEDSILKKLREQQICVEWNTIASKMVEQYGLPQRSGKQCRQRYHNHLDSSFMHSEWTKEEDRLLFSLHCQLGNKWALIAHKMSGRTDNCVKNHFYSKMRKAVRKLNKNYCRNFTNQGQEIKLSIVYKIVEAADQCFKGSNLRHSNLIDHCWTLKNNLLEYSNDGIHQNSEGTKEKERELLEDILKFAKNYRKKASKTRRTTKADSIQKHNSTLEISKKNSIGNQLCKKNNSVQNDEDSKFQQKNSKKNENQPIKQTVNSPQEYLKLNGVMSSTQFQFFQEENAENDKIFLEESCEGCELDRFLMDEEVDEQSLMLIKE